MFVFLFLFVLWCFLFLLLLIFQWMNIYFYRNDDYNLNDIVMVTYIVHFRHVKNTEISFLLLLLHFKKMQSLLLIAFLLLSHISMHDIIILFFSIKRKRKKKQNNFRWMDLLLIPVIAFLWMNYIVYHSINQIKKK